MDNGLNKENLDLLFDCVLSLETKGECARFFEDICMIPELSAISQRIIVAKMITEGKVYKEIGEKTGASTATISRVKRSLQYGANGYDVPFERLGVKENKK